MKERFRLTKNALKILAAVSMLIDHIGFIFFPGAEWLRIAGRLAFPIFAYSIYEGCKYTRNKPKYLLRVFALGFICLTGYYFYDRSLYFNVVMKNLLIFQILVICYQKTRLYLILYMRLATNFSLFLIILKEPKKN